MGLFAGIRGFFRRLRETAGCAGRGVVGLALIGLLVTAFMRDLRQFPRSLTWPVAQGEVVQSEFIADDDFSVEFGYRYTVDDVTYEGSRITFFQYAVFANRYQNRRFIEEHPVGTPVTVRYDPLDPSRSVLMRTIPLSQMWSPLLFALCLVSVLASGLMALLFRGVRRLLWRRGGGVSGGS